MAERVDLYRFTEPAASLIWTLTSADIEYSYDAGDGVETYTPTPMGRGKIEQRQEITKANLEVTLDITHELAIRQLSVLSENQLFLTVFSKQGATVGTSWKGRLQSIRPGDTSIILIFESVFTSMKRPGIRARYQRSCRHALYGRGCWLDPANFDAAGTVTAISGDVLTVTGADAQADGYWTGGMLRAPDGTLSYIIAHSGTSITVQRLSYSLRQSVAPFAVTLYPGCDHSRATCAAKFDNSLNYGGFDWIPTKNPLGGSSIV